MREPDDFRTPDSEDEGSTDVSNPYRNIRWTGEKPRLSETDVEAEAEQDEEGPTSAFPEPPPPHPSHVADPVTIIGSSGETTIYPEADETVPPTEYPTRITLPPYDHLSEYENDAAQEEEVEEEIFVQPNPTNVPTPGYRPARDRSTYPPDYSSPELMELETGDPDDFSQGVVRQEDPPSESNRVVSANSDPSQPR